MDVLQERKRQERERLLRRSLDRYQRRLEQDLELQRSAPSPEAVERLASGDRSSIEILALACSLHADRPALGARAFTVEDGVLRYLPRYQTLSYAELWARVQQFASGLRHGGLVQPGDRVAISGFASVDWLVADFACLYLAAVSVPLQTGMPAADLQQILGEVEPRAIVCSAEQLDAIAPALASCPAVRSLIVMDLEERDLARARAVAARMEALREEHGQRLALFTVADVARIGRQHGIVPHAILSEARAGEPDPLMAILYTSGSTGTPKGAMFPESLVRAQWRAQARGRVSPVASISVGYMPLNHAAGRFEVMRSIMEGGVTHLVLASDMSTLFEDIRISRPTRFLFVPRVSAMIHQHYQAELVRRGAGRASGAAGRIEAEIMAEMRRSFLGDRLVYGVAGTAPTAPEIIDFLERCFEIPIYDGYGSTEAGVISFDGRLSREDVLAFKIADVPELGYRATDAPHPRGELRVKMRRHVPGYYRNAQATRDLFDEEGYLQTGDIVELHGEDEIVWLDRKKNVLKLAQGEFVSTSRLEGVYAAMSPFIQQIYVHGSSLRAYLLAVVVPDQRAVEAHLGPAASEGAIKQLVRGELDRIAREAGLPRWEVPREILIEASPFTRENGLLTASNKPARPKLKERYGARLDRMFEEIERTQLEKLQQLEGQRAGASAAEQVALAMEVTLGLRDVDLRQTFVELGGDSLAAVRLSTMLEERFGVAVPVGLILDPTSSAQRLVAHVEERAGGAARAVTFSQVHGAGATVVRAADLRLERFLAPEELDEAARSAAPASGVRAALLTGANGFLGRFLLLELLERAPRDGGKVFCVVRAASDAEALARLGAAYRADPALRRRFEELSADGRLEALAGDLMKPRLGLSGAVFDRLCDEVDGIVHNGALVNHAFSYPQLFEPNVLGTAEIIRLALRRRRKAVGYVSTVGVAGGRDPRDPVREDEDAQSLWKERPTDSGYAVGYAASKWAGEVLLHDLAQRFGVPVGVFRCSMIMPDRRCVGEVNTSDFLTRLLAGIVYTAVAPRSFYAGEGAHHFDGLPVDFVAGSIAAVVTDLRAGFATYHVTNPHWEDAVSLDTMVDWIRTAGYEVSRIDEYARWYEAFRERLEALSQAQRQRSPLPILRQWARPIGRELRFDTARLEQRLREIAARPGARVDAAAPHLTEEYLHKYLRDMVAAGVIAGRAG
ncbi:oxidoreductase [Sorangium cellulosum]|uniref:Oxidoreductase n=1 Tax=Sorangium cellulosum TaxID=56 RepID=A0A2L0EID8_SORCE|nr:thioester reductase domain-containing protein [Sorangium cellulosum]AUX39065.1 oxidoreductase [Sorangium cellulosum]